MPSVYPSPSPIKARYIKPGLRNLSGILLDMKALEVSVHS